MTNGKKVNTEFSALYRKENLSGGYVKLYRSITKKSWYTKSEHVHLFCHLMLKASHSGFETWFNGTTIQLKPGQLVTGRQKLSEETGIDQHKIDRILKLFESEQQIKQQTSNKSRLISIINWNDYQNGEQQTKQQVSNKCTTSEQQVSTIQERKECLNKEKKVREAHSHSSFSKEEVEAFSSYQSWIATHAAEVGKMKEPLTIKQFSAFQKKYSGPAGQKLFKKALLAMSNWSGLHKKISAYKTLLNWISNERYDEEMIKLRETCLAVSGTGVIKLHPLEEKANMILNHQTNMVI